jgi:outer membrane protein assembly factor BamB
MTSGQQTIKRSAAQSSFRSVLPAKARILATSVRKAPPPTMPQKLIPDPEDSNSLAIIDGALCRMNRKGRAVVRHEPIGTAVVQFLAAGEGRLIVREHTFGILPGFSNLYCLDSALRLIWFADLPAETDLYAGPVMVESGMLVCASTAGVVCRLDPATGKILASEPAARPMAAVDA